MILLNGMVQDVFVPVASMFAAVAMKTATKEAATMKCILCSAELKLVCFNFLDLRCNEELTLRTFT